MTREEAWRSAKGYLYDALSGEEADEIIKALEQEPCETVHGSTYGGVSWGGTYKSQEPCKDVISRQAVLDAMQKNHRSGGRDIDGDYIEGDYREYLYDDVMSIPPVTPQPKSGYCKDCKWWKDSDGEYRRGVHAESKCPINRKEVFEGNGYCYIFELQKSEG